MSSAINPDLFDIRVVERHISEGRITRKDYDKWLASLPDEAEEGEETTTLMTVPTPAAEA
jgi:hypothetical protein